MDLLRPGNCLWEYKYTVTTFNNLTPRRTDNRAGIMVSLTAYHICYIGSNLNIRWLGQ